MTQSDVLVADPKPDPAAAPVRRRRRRPLAALPYVIIGIYLLTAVFGPLVIDYDPVATTVKDRLLPPGSM